ncbi:MAG: PDZ domain-containing protein [Crocinitomicaceae bacterium]|nr:PDZ domain-containing protein [Crocinitomicaceae bacterium]
MQQARFFLAAMTLVAVSTAFSQETARIQIKKEQNGKVTEETRTIEIAEGQDIQTVLKDMGVLDEFGQLKSGQQFTINIEKKGVGGDDRNLQLYYSPSLSLPPMAVLPECSPATPQEPKAFLGVMLRNNIDAWNNASPASKNKITGGVMITEIIDDTPAEKAGLNEGDVVTAIDGKATNRVEELVDYIQSKKPGDTVKVDYVRNGKKKNIRIKLGEKNTTPSGYPYYYGYPEPESPMWQSDSFNFRFNPDSITIICPDKRMKCDSMKICQPFSWNRDGFSLSETAFLGITPGKESGEDGVVIGSVVERSAAEEMGLRQGDIILSFNGNTVNSFEDISQQVGAAQPGDDVALVIRREGREKQISGKLGKRAVSDKDGMRIFHDFKGMDENGNYLYDYEFDMDQNDIEQQMEELLQMLDNQQDRISEERERLNDELLKLRENKETLSLSIEIDEITKEEAEIVNQKASPKLETGNSLSLEKIVFFPNPNEGIINLSFTSPEKGNLSVVLFDSTGAKVYYESISSFSGSYSNTIDISHQPNGSYYLQLSVNGKTYSRKVIKG